MINNSSMITLTSDRNETIELTFTELKYLKKLVNDYIKEKYPEELL